MENLKINIHELSRIVSEKVEPTLFFSLIKSKAIGDTIEYNSKKYLITGATSSNGTFHFSSSETKGRTFYKKRKTKLMVQSRYLNEKTNQIFLKVV